MSIENLKRITCEGCVHGIMLCETRPCWGTPADIRKIVDAGFGKRLMFDWWVGTGSDVEILAPAIVGHEGQEAPSFPMGKCTFLTEDKKCELHDLGLKPLEGAAACCKVGTQPSMHHDIAMTWANPEAQALVKEVAV